MAIDQMMAKNAKDFENFEVEVVLKEITTRSDVGKVTLVFYSFENKSTFRRTYAVDDVKGRLDFTRAAGGFGATKNNYDKWFNKMMMLKIPFKISVSSSGFVRYIKILPVATRALIAKHLILDSVEGLEESDREFLLTLPLETIKETFGS